MNKLSEFTIYFKKKGLKETVSRIVSRYFAVTEFVLLRNDLVDTKFNFTSSPDVEYRVGEIDKLIQYRLVHSDLPREFYVDQSHGGKEFYLGYYKGELAQICWVFRKGEYSRFFHIKDNYSCELNYTITLASFRGLGLVAKMSNYICNQLKIEKINSVYIGISSGNVSCISAMQSTNFHQFKKVKSFISFTPKTSV